MDNSHISVAVLASYIESGGAESALYNLLSGLDRQRFRPRVLCLRRDPGFIGRELQTRGIPLVSGLSRGKFDPLVAYRTARAVGNLVDILYCLDHHNVLFWLPYIVRLVKTKANVVICHSTRNPKGGKVFRPADRPGLRRMQRIIAVAEGQKYYLVEQEGLPSQKIEVIYNGISPEAFSESSARYEDRKSVRKELGLDESHRVATIVAHLRPEKNHCRFLRIATEVAKRLPEARFVVAGEGPERPRLEACARSLGIEGLVRFTGVRRDIARVLAASDVVSLTSDDRVETFPMAVLEAMAAARPVIATRVGSLEEMVIDGKNGYLVPVNDEATFAEVLFALLSDKAKAEAIGNAGQRLVSENFTIQHMIQAHEKLFESLLSERLTSRIHDRTAT
jgi:glycosyltransferase involved in cell wall biosynthesis